MSPELLGGRFRTEREVGRGGSGVVYFAHDTITEAPVALKVVLGSFGAEGAEEVRFTREGNLLRALSHPNIVRVMGSGTLASGEPYIAMEWLEGEDVAQRLKRGGLSERESLRIIADIADALHAAHGSGVVHRDVKPSNIFLTQEGVAKLVDFGVASAEDVRITKTGAIIGTPAYMAPEQARGERYVDARADTYALGATLFEMLAGRPPHVGPTPIAILARLVTTPAPKLSELRSGVYEPLDVLLTQMLSVDPEDRPTSMAEVRDRLREMAPHITSGSTTQLEPSPVSEQPSGPIANVGGQRVVTSVLATRVPKGPSRQRLVAYLRSRGAEATELGGDAMVAHLGVKKSVGAEAALAVSLAVRLAEAGASVGVATGRSRIDRQGPQGDVVDRAAALSRDANKGQVLTDMVTAEFLRGKFETQQRSDGAVAIGAEFEVQHEMAYGGAPFVGREPELMQLSQSFEHAMEDKVPTIATLTARSGMGKTRLTREFMARIHAHASAPRVLVLRSEAFAKGSPFAGAAQCVRTVLDLDRTQTAEEVEQALLERGAQSGSPLAIRALAKLVVGEPLGAELVGVRDALWLTLTELVLTAVRTRPYVFVVEDAQWADADSLGWLEHMLGRATGSALFVLLTMRPEFWREHAGRFEGRDHLRIELRPLAQKHVRLLALSLLGGRATGESGSALLESITAQASGSPLFAEELARLSVQGKDATSAATIEAAIQVQLDSLDESARATAARLSVFGGVGWDLGVQALGSEQPAVDLRALALADMVVEQDAPRFKKTREWAFRHALMREVAYASLGEEQLRDLHGKAGRFLREQGEDDLAVARHFELAHEPNEAAVHFERGARRALLAHSLSQAVSLAERALAASTSPPVAFARALLLDEALSRLDPRSSDRASAIEELELSAYDAITAAQAQGARARYRDACGGGDEIRVALEEAMQEARAHDLTDEWGRCGAALAARLGFAGDLDRANAVANMLLSATGIGAETIVEAWQTLAVVHQARGEVVRALDARKAAADAALKAQLLTRQATLMANVGFALTMLGAQAEARAMIEQGVELAERLGATGVVRHCKMVLLCWNSTFGIDPAHEKALRPLRELADGAADGNWVAHDRSTLGILFYRAVELRRENDERATRLLRLTTQGYRTTNMLDLVPVSLGHSAAAELARGNVERSLELAREARGLLLGGSPSLLNEAPVFLALLHAASRAGFSEEARESVRCALPLIERRAKPLVGTPYLETFLALPDNATLLSHAAAQGLAFTVG